MSGQTSIILAVFLIAGIMIIWAASTFHQSSTRVRILSLGEIDRMSKQVDMIKGLSRNLLQLSVYKATISTAGRGSVFYCNQISTPTVDEIRYELAFSANNSFNEYLSHIKSSDERLALNITPSVCISFDIKEGDLYNGKYDEKFNASVFGSSIKVKYGENEIVSSNDIKDEGIVRDRFWLLYRGLKRWVETTDAFSTSCDCLSAGCGCSLHCDNCEKCNCENCKELYECLEQKVAKKSVQQLESIFQDPFIECTANLDKCELDVQSSGCDSTACVPGSLSTCFICDTERKSYLCENNLLYGLVGAQETEKWSCIVNKKTVKLNVGMTVTCIDKKYSLPSETGQSFLTYIIKLYFSFEQKGLCAESVESDYPIQACECVPIPNQPPVNPGGPQPPPPV